MIDHLLRDLGLRKEACRYRYFPSRLALVEIGLYAGFDPVRRRIEAVSKTIEFHKRESVEGTIIDDLVKESIP